MYLKRAVKVNEQGNMYLDCECGHEVSLPVIAHMPMTFECLCGLEYDSRGYILNRKSLSGIPIPQED
jgi:hypothetical protein